MNEPIINPWIIYLISRVCAIKCLLYVTSIVAFLVAFFASMNELENISPKKALVVCVVSIVFNVFIPHEETIYKMIVAQHVTPANIQMVGEGAEKAVDKVIEKILNYQIKLEKKDGR